MSNDSPLLVCSDTILSGTALCQPVPAARSISASSTNGSGIRARSSGGVTATYTPPCRPRSLKSVFG